MFDLLFSVMLFSVVLSSLVVIHEFGHYLFARVFQVGIAEFSVGFGNVIYSVKDKKDTKWSLRAWLLGGYVSIKNDGTQEYAHIIGKTMEEISYWKKILIILAGPFFNFIAAFILSMFIYGFFGYSVQEKTMIGETKIINLQTKDEILEIDNKKVESWKQIYIALFNKQESIMTIKRNNQIMHVSVKAIEEMQSYKPNLIIRGLSLLNLMQIPSHITKRFWDFKPLMSPKKQLSLLENIQKSLQMIWNAVVDFFSTLKMVFSVGLGLLAGPIGIAKGLFGASKLGMQALLEMSMKLSLSLGLFNLLPLPMLDGGQIFIASIEKVFGKLPSWLSAIWAYSGLILILGLLLYMSVLDIIK